MPWAMAKHCLFLIIALMVICVSSLTVPSDSKSYAYPKTRASPTSSHNSHASSTHHGNNTTPSNQQDSNPQPNSVIPETVASTPTPAIKAAVAAASSPAKSSQHHPKIPPILVILSILFGIPLLAFLVVTLALSCCRRHPEPQKKEITLNTWDIFRKDRMQAAAAAKRSQTLSPSSGSPGISGRRSKFSGIGLGLSDVDLGPSSAARVIRHTPRRPSPLRQVYTAAESVRGAASVETPASVLSEFGSANSLPRSALHYYQGSTTRSPGSPASSAASPSPRTPGTEEILPFDGRAKQNLDAVYRPSVIVKEHDRGEVDISDAYESYFVLGEGEDEDALIGTACW